MRVLLMATLWFSASMAAEASTPITVSLDSDVLVLLKVFVWFVGILIAIFAFLGVTFFGFDIRKARASISEVTDEAKKLLSEARKAQSQLEELKEKLEQLGAQLEDQAEGIPNPNAKLETSIQNDQEPRTKSELVLDAIRRGSYEWTTIGRIEKRTSLSRDQILEIARQHPSIVISTGKKTQDFIFKLKPES